MDNRVFNINGESKEQLKLALQLLLLDEGGRIQEPVGWYYSQEKGFVLTWFVKEGYKAIPFTNRLGQPAPINQIDLLELLWTWLESDEAKKVKLEGWDVDADHDGSNEWGWRLYTEDWGHIKESKHSMDSYSIGALKPAWIWYGK